MKATDFRIGNYLHDRKGRLCKVEELVCREGERDVYAPVISGPTTSLPNKPIPLTKEWLLKAGFKEVNNNFNSFSALRLNVLSYGRITFYPDSKVMYCELSQDSGYKVGNPVIKYVHQLQNLYHALTGEELTLINA